MEERCREEAVILRQIGWKSEVDKKIVNIEQINKQICTCIYTVLYCIVYNARIYCNMYT